MKNISRHKNNLTGLVIINEKLLQLTEYCKCNKVECCASAFSIFGGFFAPLIDPTLRMVGFGLWLVGNVLWLSFAYKKQQWGLWSMQFVFSFQNFAGLVNMIFVNVT